MRPLVSREQGAQTAVLFLVIAFGDAGLAAAAFARTLDRPVAAAGKPVLGVVEWVAVPAGARLYE